MNKTLIKKILIAAFLIGVAVVFRVNHLERYFSLEYIKSSQAQFALLYAKYPLFVIGVYFLVYITAAAMALPGAAVLTLAGGGLFGFLEGLLTVSFASTVGATVACALSRFILRDSVQNRFGDKLVTINEGVDREGAFYLFSLRLVPIFPFFVINLLMGLTRMPLRTFCWVSQLGMLPATIVYVNAGKELAKIDSLSGILSPGLLISFAILGFFPLAVKKLLTYYRCAMSNKE